MTLQRVVRNIEILRLPENHHLQESLSDMIVCEFLISTYLILTFFLCKYHLFDTKYLILFLCWSVVKHSLILCYGR